MTPEVFWTRCAANTGEDIQCSLPRGVAAAPESAGVGAAGNVYASDQANKRIVAFSPWGEFQRTWGWDVVSGPLQSQSNEVQVVTVKATAGQFRLTFGAGGPGVSETADISATATSAEVQIALNALTNISTGGGSVSVSGGPGGEKGLIPYRVLFNSGPLAHVDVAKLGTAVGTTPLSGGNPSSSAAVITTNPGATGFEICVPENGDVCKAGIETASEGSSSGLFGVPQGVSVDSAGNIYVVDRPNKRIEKFDSEGNFVLMFGGQVNKTKVDAGAVEPQQNRCPISPGDICKVGVENPAAGKPGKLGTAQFGEWVVLGSYISVDTKSTVSTADDEVFVGDKGRVAVFNSNGEWIRDIVNPEVLESKKVSSLAVATSGNLFVGREANTNVVKLNASTGAKECEDSVPTVTPRAVATDSAGSSYVVEGATGPVRKFNPSCVEVVGEEALFPFFTYPFVLTPTFGNSTGIGTSSACLSSGYDLHLSNSVAAPSGFVRAHGPPPDEDHIDELCPPPEQAPEVEDQAALTVETDRAMVQATINPRFWQDTSFHVQYGTADCIKLEGWGGSCVQRERNPDALLGAGAIGQGAKTEKVELAALLPGTAYRYRFVAQNRFDAEGNEVNEKGGPVFGEGGVEGVDGEDAGFTTTVPVPPPETCPNQASRTGDSSFLPDCRAYEMVSPVDKNGGDINPLITELYVQATPEGDRISYSAPPAFGDQASNKLSNQYLATRGGGGWANHGINLPLVTQVGGSEPLGQRPPVAAFSEDLCGVWLADYNDPPLLEDAVAGRVNLYRQRLCGSGGLELLSGGGLLGGANPDYNSVQGFSASGERVFVSAGRLEVAPGSVAAAPTANSQAYVYERGAPIPHLVSVLPNGSADPGVLTAGAEVGGGTLNSTPGPLEHAVSNDGSRVFWGSGYGGFGFAARLYLRENPIQPQSALAEGTGDVSVTIAGAITSEGSQVVVFFGASGTFSVGNPISGPGIPAGATITAVNETAPGEGELEISVPASASELFVEIASGSKTVANLSMETGAFEVGQTVSGEGIPAGATVTACSPSCGPAATSLTLSAGATESKAGAKLTACTEAGKGCTVPVSEAGGGSSDAFWGATPSGSEVLFSEGDLKNSAPGEATLHTFDVEAGTRTQVAEEVMGVLGGSDDLSRIYYVSSEDLTGAQENSVGDVAQEGEPNLYLDEEGNVTFVGTLLDGTDGDLLGSNGTYGVGTVMQLTDATRVSPDGAHIAFQSRARLTDFDNSELGSGEPMVEVFTYEAGGELNCVSCDPRGVRSSGRELPRAQTQATPNGIRAAAWIPGRLYQLHSRRVLSEGGGRLFFNSFVPLLPRDQNGAMDVYEWEAPGEGGCDEADVAFHEQNGGCLYLISTGESPSDSEFWEASAEGSDVFFTTASSLLPQDPGLIDVYDARVAGGFPQPAAAAECEGEACQSPPAPPAYVTPSSSAYQGAGDPPKKKPKPCRKGKVRRKGRCVPRKQHKRTRQRRNADSNRGAAR